MDPESARQFPFREELRAIFDARMQRLMWQAAAGGQDQDDSKKKNKSKKSARFLISDDDESILEQDKNNIANSVKKRKIMPGESCSSDGVVEMVEELLRRQGRMEMEWCREEEAREAERTAKEADWRRAVQALERERMAAEQRWREAEEQRRDREEARAERRDALITALINSLLQYAGGLP